MSELAAIDILIKSDKVKVELAKSLNALKVNKHFKRVFLDHYGKEYAAGLVRGKANQMIQGADSQAYVDSQINAISHLFQFMDIALAEGAIAAEDILQHEVERSILLEEA